MLALAAIFFPSFLLIAGALPFWDLLRSEPVFQSVLKGVNAAVVGLLLTALYTPVWTSSIHSPADFGLGLVAFGLLMFWQCPPWLVVVFTAVGGEVMARI
jgi:chromate transporter